jgi:hypothetical protein
MPTGRTTARSNIMAPPLGSSASKYSPAKAVVVKGMTIIAAIIIVISDFLTILNIIFPPYEIDYLTISKLLSIISAFS